MEIRGQASVSEVEVLVQETYDEYEELGAGE